MSDVGNATGYSSSTPQDLGVSDAQDVKPSTKVDLLNDLAALADGRSARPMTCSVGLMLLELTDEERTKMAKVLDDSSVRATWVAEVLVKHGYKIASSSIQRHRRRSGGSGCACP